MHFKETEFHLELSIQITKIGYNLLSPGYQQKVSNKGMQPYLNQIYGMAGKFKSAKFNTTQQMFTLIRPKVQIMDHLKD